MLKVVVCILLLCVAVDSFHRGRGMVFNRFAGRRVGPLRALAGRILGAPGGGSLRSLIPRVGGGSLGSIIPSISGRLMLDLDAGGGQDASVIEDVIATLLSCQNGLITPVCSTLYDIMGRLQGGGGISGINGISGIEPLLSGLAF